MASNKKHPAQIYVAKYVPCLERYEPRNIGVIVWNNGRIEAVFFKNPPAFVNDKKTYQRWMEWIGVQLPKDVLAWRRGNGSERTIAPRSRDQPEFMNALQCGFKGNFLLSSAAELMDRQKMSETPNIAYEFFRSLVALPKKDVPTLVMSSEKQEPTNDRPN
jgi:hypothetical protein